MKINEEVKKCIREAIYIPFCTAGTHKYNWGTPPYGAHMLLARADMITFVDDETIAWPAGALAGTESNLRENGKIQILATLVRDGRLVDGYRLEGNGEFLIEGPVYEEIRKKYDWARGCVVMKVERVGQSNEFVTRLLKY